MNGIFTIKYYSNIKKGCVWVSSNEVDGSRDCYTERSKSERQIPCTNTHTCHLERCCWWPHLVDSRRDQMRSKDSVTAGEGEVGWLERAALKHMLPQWRREPVGVCRMTQGTQSGCFVMNQRGALSREAGGEACACLWQSCWYMADAITILWIIIFQLKFKKPNWLTNAQVNDNFLPDES